LLYVLKYLTFFKNNLGIWK